MTFLSTDAGFWNKVARKYATDPIKDIVGYERTLERTGELLSADDDVLELGCGTGMSALRLAGRVRSIHATDISDEMINIARGKAEAVSHPNLTFAVASAETLAFKTFDAVLAFNLLHLVRDRHAMLRHVLGALKPGGHLISKTPCLSEMNPLIRLALPLMRAIGKAPDVAFFTGKTLEQDIERAGFSVVERGRHGSRGNDPRIFIVAQKPSILD